MTHPYTSRRKVGTSSPRRGIMEFIFRLRIFIRYNDVFLNIIAEQPCRRGLQADSLPGRPKNNKHKNLSAYQNTVYNTTKMIQIINALILKTGSVANISLRILMAFLSSVPCVSIRLMTIIMAATARKV